MRKFLMLAWYFPPRGGAGVQRSLKYVRYLPGLGWQPVVLTSTTDAKSSQDETLLAEIPPDVPVHHAHTWQLPGKLPFRIRNFITRWFLTVDEQVGWLPSALAAGHQLIREHRPDVIYTTSAPYSAHLAGRRLAQATGLPWVADFRDPWIGNFYLKFATPLHARLVTRLEASVVASASRVILVSEPIREDFIRRYPAQAAEKFITITNGYDGADFPADPAPPSNARFTVTYSGTVYRQISSPRPFLEALRSAIAARQIDPVKICVRFVGNAGPAHTDARDLGLEHIVEFSGYVEHHQSIEAILQSDLLLLVIGNSPGSAGVLTGKVYEYLAARRPILAMVPPGAAADLIEHAHAGVVVPPDDAAEIQARLVAAYQDWLGGSTRFEPDLDWIRQFDRKTLSARLAGVLDDLAEKKEPQHD